MTNDEQRDAYNEALADLPNCAVCRHPYHATICDIEYENSFCYCRNFEAESRETILEREHPEEI